MLYCLGLFLGGLEFGKLAEAWHMKEVNISFEGHNAERTQGVRVLSPEKLQKGDVSMEIVSKRMKRTYSSAFIFHPTSAVCHPLSVACH